ncbi:hypothetical protein HZH68_001018 [Vespula germanica]|uniref:Uncharacterized protein n=1 Tax=Vespula germanica TaxID=30212 RepID=A0A834U6K0_VESGE|nr:hypothetical protein HZH68_001018 [Vespula germanica]
MVSVTISMMEEPVARSGHISLLSVAYWKKYYSYFCSVKESFCKEEEKGNSGASVYLFLIYVAIAVRISDILGRSRSTRNDSWYNSPTPSFLDPKPTLSVSARLVNCATRVRRLSILPFSLFLTPSFSPLVLISDSRSNMDPPKDRFGFFSGVNITPALPASRLSHDLA